DSFTDHYLGVPFDLSEVLFVATANFPQSIPGPLLDRLETVTFAGYTEREKLEIAKRYLVPRQVRENGLTLEQLTVTDAALGDIMFAEASVMRGKGELVLTGQLGDVMKESARAALTYAKSHADQLGIQEEAFAGTDVHIHVPAGAIPKDGPSAGVTMATALVSLLTKRRITPLLAMTGEITLSGNVLPVGGIKEKVLAAKRAGVRDVILPSENKMNVEEDLTPEQLENLTVHYV